MNNKISLFERALFIFTMPNSEEYRNKHKRLKAKFMVVALLLMSVATMVPFMVTPPLVAVAVFIIGLTASFGFMSLWILPQIKRLRDEEMAEFEMLQGAIEGGG